MAGQKGSRPPSHLSPRSRTRRRALPPMRTLRDGEDRLTFAEAQVAVSAIAVYKALGGESQ